MREFIKKNKENLILFCVVVLVYALICVIRVNAEENVIEDMPENVHILYELHNIPPDNLEEGTYPYEIIKLLQDFNEMTMGYYQWSLALKGLQVGLIIALIFAVVWGR